VPLKDFSPTPDMESELDATFYHSIFSWFRLTFFMSTCFRLWTPSSLHMQLTSPHRIASCIYAAPRTSLSCFRPCLARFTKLKKRCTFSCIHHPASPRFFPCSYFPMLLASSYIPPSRTRSRSRLRFTNLHHTTFPPTCCIDTHSLTPDPNRTKLEAFLTTRCIHTPTFLYTRK
jgi:hypothetical protein